HAEHAANRRTIEPEPCEQYTRRSSSGQAIQDLRYSNSHGRHRLAGFSRADAPLVSGTTLANGKWWHVAAGPETCRVAPGAVHRGKYRHDELGGQFRQGPAGCCRAASKLE